MFFAFNNHLYNGNALWSQLMTGSAQPGDNLVQWHLIETPFQLI
jgi:hypothetical protein